MNEGQEMDSALLAAVAGFLGDFEAPPEVLSASRVASSGGGSPGSEEARPRRATSRRYRAPATEERRLKANERRERYRKKVKGERETLTQQKEALTAKLIRLQQAHEETKEGDEKNRSTLALSAWRATAARQKELRREAEALQQKLKEAVWCQSAVIQNLNVTLQQSLSNRPVKRLTSVDGQESGTKAKSALFNVLMGELNALYAETGDLVRGARCEFQRPDVNKMRRKWNQDRSLLRSTVATIVPADFERTWRALSLILLSDDSGIHYTGKIVDPENTIVMTYQQTFSLKSGKTATSVVYYAARRYIEENRVVFVWRVLNEGHGEFASLLSNEHAWLVISHFASTQTLLESYSRLMPIGMGDTSLRDGSRLDQFVQHLLKADEAEINDVNLAMERLLSQKHSDDDNKCD